MCTPAKLLIFIFLLPVSAKTQNQKEVKLVKVENDKRVDIYIGTTLFTRFLYPRNLEKPVLFPIFDAGSAEVTRGFPLKPLPGEPTDHPHHVGLWLTYENVNGIDFWNNSYAIPEEKKYLYGRIETDSILDISSGSKGVLHYHANWVNQKNEILMEETTGFEFSGIGQERIIDRVTELKAATDILFTDAKDGMLGLRIAHELQIPDKKSRSYTDNKGNISIVNNDSLAGGNYLTSDGKQGDSVWSTRARWCKVYGKIGKDSVSITIFDHAHNLNYPTFWHARGYGLFAANPLGEKIFTKGKSSLNLKLEKGETISFRYRVLIQNGKTTPSFNYLNQMAESFNGKK